MSDPLLVRDCCDALFDGAGGDTPVTVKCRIGTDLDWEPGTTMADYKAANMVDDEREYQRLASFVDTVSANGVVSDFQIHARIAVLSRNFSPADNRKIPPLKYHHVRRLCADFPHLTFSLNGGVESLAQVEELLNVDDDGASLRGVMVGRALAADPWSFAAADAALWRDDARDASTRADVLRAYGAYADDELARRGPRARRFLLRAVVGLFAGEPRSKRFRIELDRVAGDADDPTPLSTRLAEAAERHLSTDTLRGTTPRDSLARSRARYERATTTAAKEWAERREEDRARQEEENGDGGGGGYESLLNAGIADPVVGADEVVAAAATATTGEASAR